LQDPGWRLLRDRFSLQSLENYSIRAAVTYFNLCQDESYMTGQENRVDVSENYAGGGPQSSLFLVVNPKLDCPAAFFNSLRCTVAQEACSDHTVLSNKCLSTLHRTLNTDHGNGFSY
jgi:hypothetical protein